MLCEYLRHIDLLAVYEQLDDFNYGRSGPELGNIPEPLAQTMAMHFEARADSTFEHLYNGRMAWQELRPIDVAAEVGYYIERDIEALSEYCSKKAPSVKASQDEKKWFRQFESFSIDALYGDAEDYFLLQSLLVCQYDALCWLHSRQDFDGGLFVLERIVLATEMLSTCGKGDPRPSHYQKAAEARHQETRQQRALALVAWDEYGTKVSSMAAFARARHKDFGVTERTLYGWIRDHRKAHS
jgi:hypothetical protein